MTTTDTRNRTTGEFGKSLTKELQALAGDRLARGSMSAAPLASNEEILIVDARSALSPSQAVENRLSSLLSGSSLPISHLLVRGRLLSR